MTIQLEQLKSHPRLLLEARLQPIQGARFQPTGFPDLGAAVYEAPGINGGPIQTALLESAQSVANRLESVCWDSAANAPHPAINGMPYVSVALWDSNDTTNSMLEAHRLNSPYIANDDKFSQQFCDDANLPSRRRTRSRAPRSQTPPNEDAQEQQDEPQELGVFDQTTLASLAKAAFKYDPGSVLHGVFLEKFNGRARLQRCLSGFIEAQEVKTADSGGVKNDRVAPSPASLQEIGITAGAAEGYGNVPFHRTEYTAERITAYFNLDLAQIRAYGLGENAERFLVTLALWKVRKFLDTGLRLRTACDLDLAGDLEVTRPKAGFAVPATAELEAELPALINDCKKLFADPPVTELTFQRKK